MYQLAVLCREMFAERSVGRRNLVEDPPKYLFQLWCFIESILGEFYVDKLETN
jgi:hypothetical protein